MLAQWQFCADKSYIDRLHLNDDLISLKGIVENRREAENYA